MGRGEKGGESSNNKRVKHGDKNFPPDERERGRNHHLPRCRDDALFAHARTLPDIGSAKVFPFETQVFPRFVEKRSLCDALLNIRLTPQRRLRILIDKLYLIHE